MLPARDDTVSPSVLAAFGRRDPHCRPHGVSRVREVGVRDITRVLGRHDLAKEAAQQTFVRAWQTADRFDPTRDPAPWLATIARRVAIDIFRREGRRPTSPLAEVAADDPRVVSPPADSRRSTRCSTSGARSTRSIRGSKDRADAASRWDDTRADLRRARYRVGNREIAITPRASTSSRHDPGHLSRTRYVGRRGRHRATSVRTSTYGRFAMPASGSILGNAVRRLEDPALLTGAGKYVDDLVEPNMAHVAFVRSTVAHANLVSVDVTEASSMPGVVAVYHARWRRPRSPVVAAVPGDARDVEPARVRHGQGAIRRRHRRRRRRGDPRAGRRCRRARRRRVRPVAVGHEPARRTVARRAVAVRRARLERVLRLHLPGGGRRRPARRRRRSSPRSRW